MRILTLIITNILFTLGYLTAQSEDQSPVYDFDLGISQEDYADLDFDLESLTSQSINYALIIGVEDYQDSNIKDLDRPVTDAARLRKVLQDYYTFEESNIRFLKNATRKQIIEELDVLSKKVTSLDNLIVFYAGHGTWDEALKVGYWLPSDAKINDKSTWFPNSQLRDYIKGIDTKHTLLIADACFSGGIFKTRSAVLEGASKSIQTVYKEKSRRAMTSGVLKEVPDESIFLDYLVQRLRKNKELYLTAEELFWSFKNIVINQSENGQIPQYGEISGTNDQGGSFVFIRKK